jgi:hypothetical protein
VSAFSRAKGRLGTDAGLPEAEHEKFLLLTNSTAPQATSQDNIFSAVATGSWVDASVIPLFKNVPPRVEGQTASRGTRWLRCRPLPVAIAPCCFSVRLKRRRCASQALSSDALRCTRSSRCLRSIAL